VELIIDACPYPNPLLGWADQRGHLPVPLHLFASMSNPTLLQRLLEVYPGAARKFNNNQELPLHRACEAYDVSSVKDASCLEQTKEDVLE
jgi:hypothetical protein